MANATNQQVQVFSDSRVRPRCEALRALYNQITDDKANINDVYQNLANNPTWTDNRTDGPPHLAVPNDILAYNAFITALIAFIQGQGNWAVVMGLCVQPDQG